jgi:hypothetical protein
LVVGIEIEGMSRAYKLKELREAEIFKDRLGERKVTLDYDDETDRLTVTDQSGQTIPHMLLYWFVWKGIYPESDIYDQKTK